MALHFEHFEHKQGDLYLLQGKTTTVGITLGKGRDVSASEAYGCQTIFGSAYGVVGTTIAFTKQNYSYLYVEVSGSYNTSDYPNISKTGHVSTQYAYNWSTYTDESSGATNTKYDVSYTTSTLPNSHTLYKFTLSSLSNSDPIMVGINANDGSASVYMYNIYLSNS